MGHTAGAGEEYLLSFLVVKGKEKALSQFAVVVGELQRAEFFFKVITEKGIGIDCRIDVEAGRVLLPC